MEALAVFGGVAAGFTLGAEILRLSRSLRKAIKSVRYARREIRKITDEMDMFAELFEAFLHTCCNPPGVSDTRASFSPTLLISWTRSAKRDLKNLLRKVRALAFGPKYKYSLVETFTAHVGWYFSRSSVKCLRASLSVARESMNGFMNIRSIEKLDEQLKRLKRAIRKGDRQALEAEFGITVEERMEMLEQSIRTRRQMRHGINKRLQEAKEIVVIYQEKGQGRDFIPKANHLLKFTDSVQQYVEDVLPLTRSGRGIRYFNENHEPKHEPRRADSRRPSPSIVNTSIVSEPREADPEPVQHSANTPTVLERSSTRSDIINEPSSISTEESDARSSNRGRHYSTIPSSRTSFISTSASDEAPNPTLPSSPTLTSNSPRSNNAYRSSRPKEYINDPTGTILSPPRVKDRLLLTTSKTVARNPDTNVVSTNDEPIESFPAPRDAEKRTVTREGDIAPSDNQAEESHGTETETEEEEEEEVPHAGPSPFHPIAGVRGTFPRGWHQRHDRSRSP